MGEHEGILKLYERALGLHQHMVKSWEFIYWRGVAVVAFWAILELAIVPAPMWPTDRLVVVVLGVLPSLLYLVWPRVINLPSWEYWEDDFTKLAIGNPYKAYSQWVADAFEAVKRQREINRRSQTLVMALAVILGACLLVQLFW